MKVAIITSSLSYADGWGRYSLEIINALRDYNIEINIITTKQQKRKIEGIKICPIFPEKIKFNLQAILSIYKLRKCIKDCDVIHCLVEPLLPLVIISNIGINKPFIMTAHGTYAVKPFDNKIKKKIFEYAYRKCSKIICVSNFTANKILSKIKLKNIIVINNGVNYKKFQVKYNLEDVHNENIILGVGAIKPRKGYDVSIKAVALIKKKMPNIKYYIVGSTGGKYYKYLLKIIKKEGLTKNVKFLGNINENELIKLYHLSKIFLLTPRTINNVFEGFGLVYLEANACGKPVIGTYGCGAEDAIINNYNGLLVPQDNPKKTAEAIKCLLDNPAFAKKLGENGKKRAKELSWKNIAKKIIEIYKDVIK